MSGKYEYSTKTIFVKHKKILMKNEYIVNGDIIDKEITQLLNEAAVEGWRTISINHEYNIEDLMILVLFEREL